MSRSTKNNDRVRSADPEQAVDCAKEDTTPADALTVGNDTMLVGDRKRRASAGHGGTILRVTFRSGYPIKVK